MQNTRKCKLCGMIKDNRKNAMRTHLENTHVNLNDINSTELSNDFFDNYDNYFEEEN